MKLVMLGSGSYKSSLTYYRLVALGRCLSHLGWDISLIVPGADKYNNFIADPTPHVEGIEVVQPWQLNTQHAMINLLPYLVTGLWQIVKRRPSLVYLYKPTPITIIGLLPKLLFRVPVIVDIDDLGSEVMRLQHQSHLQVWLVAQCEKLAIRFANGVVVTSRYLHEQVTAKYPHKSVLILSNGVDPREYPLARGNKPRPVIYYFGALNRFTLIEPLLRALPAIIAAVADAKVIIVGGGDALNEAQELAHELGVASHVTFTGWVEQLGVYDYARYADIAVCVQPDIPTVRAASNLKVFQYMALGNAPVVSNVGDLPLYVQPLEANSGFDLVVDAANPHALSRTIIGLLQSPQTRLKIAASARNMAETTYAWMTLAQRLNQFLQQYTPANAGKSREAEHA